MRHDPLVSVIVPAWNSERTLRQTLRSAASQTHRNIEILIVNDGSTDDTAAVAAQFCETDARARLITKENGGLSSARNRGILEAQGDWVAPIDADDLWHPTKIEKQLAAALAAPQPVGFVYCWYREVDEEGRVLTSGPRLQLSGRIFNQLAYANAVENGSALLLSRNAALSVGGYDETLRALEDVMLQLRVAQKFNVTLVPEHLVGWRRHSSNMSGDVDLIRHSARTVYTQLLAEGELAYPRSAQWVGGSQAFNTAQQRAAAGRLPSALGYLTRSLWRDPARNSLLLAYRLIRSANRRLPRRRPRRPPQAMFADVDPAAQLVVDPYALPRLASIIGRLDRNRLRRLAVLDETAGGPRSDAA